MEQLFPIRRVLNPDGTLHKKSILTTAAELADLIGRRRAGKLQPDELRGSTFALSNQGSIGGLFFTPVINHPEVAILGVDKTEARPVARPPVLSADSVSFSATRPCL